VKYRDGSGVDIAKKDKLMLGKTDDGQSGAYTYSAVGARVENTKTEIHTMVRPLSLWEQTKNHHRSITEKIDLTKNEGTISS